MTTFLLSLLLSIPVGIVANALSPWFQRRLDKSSRRAALKRNAVLDEEASGFVKDRTEMWSYLLSSLIRVAFTLSVTGLISITLLVLPQLLVFGSFALGKPDEDESLIATILETFLPLSYLLGIFVALVGLLVIMNISRRSLAVVTRVRELRSALAGTPDD